MTGQIITRHFVRCGICEITKPLAGDKPRQAAWDMGWRRTREEGWLCPDCQAHLAAGDQPGVMVIGIASPPKRPSVGSAIIKP